MAKKIKKILKEPRVLLFLLVLVLSIIAIPSFKGDAVVVSYVSPDSPFRNMIEQDDIIKSVNNVPIRNLNEYADVLEKIQPNEEVLIETNTESYTATSKESPLYGQGYTGIHVMASKSTNLEMGLDLQGGARVTLSPITVEGVEFDDELFDTTTQVLAARLNAYALKNVVIRQIQDVHDSRYIIIEMPGEGSEQVVDMVKSVGRFELKILNETVFSGDAIVPPIGEPRRDFETGQWQVSFTIRVSAAERLRDNYLENAPASPSSCSVDDDCELGYACSRDIGGGICLPSIKMFLDGYEMFSAPPARSLYQTWEFGESSRNLVVQSNTQEMAEQVKVVLEAGRLPEQIESLNVVSQDYVDPKLGSDFLRGAAIAGIVAIIAVGLVIFLRYRQLKIALPIMFTGLSEVLIVLGIATIINWTIDLPAIAGIITVIGTGVDHQVIITDELLKGQSRESWSLKRSTKTAFGIIVAAVLTTSFAMLPLLYPGFTGLYALRGFAIITIIGVLIGYFISRPAYAKIAETLLSD